LFVLLMWGGGGGGGGQQHAKPLFGRSFLLFILHEHFSTCPGKRKALKLNFANPSIKPMTRFSLNTAAPQFQNPHM
uniref:Uncharacterized protein n=1 Tax=Oryzias sinensis TaxID=183150 RepID=A0A8C7WY52_9TELE